MPNLIPIDHDPFGGSSPFDQADLVLLQRAFANKKLNVIVQGFPLSYAGQPTQELMNKWANDRGPYEEAASSPGPFTAPEMIEGSREKQKSLENNLIQDRLAPGKLM